VGAASSAPTVAAEASVDRVDGRFETTIQLGAEAPRWDEFSPALHRLTATLANGATRSVNFGLREITAPGTQFALNGRPIFIRGTLDCGNYPRTGHPPVDVAEWKRVIGVAKAHGLNLIRFHSWCPPEAAFVAADELGFYFHVEASTWPNQSTTLGDGKPIDRWLYEETERILRAYGNHPSFILMASGNEPGGKQHSAYLRKWVAHYRDHDARHLFSSAAGWPEIPENQWHCTPRPRIHAWGDGLKSRLNARPPETRTDYREFTGKRPVPVVSHEIGQWCVYPNFDEMPKYTGYLKPRNYEIFRESLRAHGMADQARQFLHASGKLQTLCYKEDIESALRTPGMGGFQLLDLHDFPGQGTALVGVLDAFWEEKGYVTPAEYARFSGPTVPLARLERRVFTSADTLEAALEVAHFGTAPLDRAVATWRLVDDAGRTVAGGRLPARSVPLGNGTALGRVELALARMPAPARYRLVVGFEGQAAENDWHLWVYPETVDTAVPSGVTVTEVLDERARAALEAGGRVLWLVPPARVRNSSQQKIALGFTPVFWNTAWTRRQAPTTLGILCDPGHPALAEFPTDAHTNWQWWYLVSRAGAMMLDELPPGARPIVQVIDDWFTARKLGLVFEARVRRGRLLVCSIDLRESGEGNPVARQLRRSLLRYMAGERFAPQIELPEDV
ncbi:MAG: glycoside hydrolase, partial [Verrucomicrobia bacterium]|nr:glycoside hydrolase [Verrucomicrobiota bacterium]